MALSNNKVLIAMLKFFLVFSPNMSFMCYLDLCVCVFENEVEIDFKRVRELTRAW